MGIVYWVGAGLGLATALAGWRFLQRADGDWTPLEQRLGDQVTVSARLEQECAESHTSYGGLSTVL